MARRLEGLLLRALERQALITTLLRLVEVPFPTQGLWAILQYAVDHACFSQQGGAKAKWIAGIAIIPIQIVFLILTSEVDAS
mmetsp:Transcript_18134/g.42110  ORF Transcript_18134/g.42110 Transcript_18134/m.42110 type:complete len:82 (-) Transcript_18134:394-639(-)